MPLVAMMRNFQDLEILKKTCAISGSRRIWRKILMKSNGRNSDNQLIAEKQGWRSSRPLREELEKTYCWIRES
jgi:hypothetical protein